MYIDQYDIDVMIGICVIDIEKIDEVIKVMLENGVVLESKIVIIVIGVGWCKLNILGEE